MRIRNLATALGALVLFLAIGCILDNRQAGRGSEVENELGVYGQMVDQNGKAVTGAKVKILPETGALRKGGAAAALDSDSTMSDSAGRYAFRGLDSGAYVLQGDYQSGTLVLLRRDIFLMDTGADLDMGADTLRPPGRIRGRLLLGDKGKGAMLCYIPGTSYLAVSDDSGRFTIDGIPQGSYRVSYSAPGFLIVTDTGVEVLASRVTVLPDKQITYDPADAPPAPTDLRAVYDTLAQSVSLTWDRVPVSDLSGFVIYRDEEGYPEPVPLRNGFASESSYIDTALGPLPDSAARILTYRVKARDQEANLSARYSAPATIPAVSRFWATTALDVSRLGGEDGDYSIGDTAVIALAFRNPTRLIDSLVWTDASGKILRRIGIASNAGRDTLRLVSDSAVVESLSIAAKDAGGTWQRRGAVVRYLRDTPWADAGRDTVITIGDSLDLRGKAGDRLGRIVSQAWDIGGSGRFETAQAGALGVRFGNSPFDSLPCVFRAVDDDGQNALDTIYITVRLDPPRADAGRDTVAGVGDTVRLQGRGSDGMGAIRLLEWDIGGKGDFRETVDGTVNWVIGPDDGVLPCVFRVTDDDGLRALDTLLVSVDLDRPVPDAGTDTKVSVGDAVELHGRGSDARGRVVRWEWDIGGRGFGDAASGDTVFIAPSAQGTIACILRITDDDGMQALDTVNVQVVRDPPVADAGPDRIVSINDLIALNGEAGQEFGYIAYWGWKCGSEQGFSVETSPQAFRTAFPSPRNAYTCVLEAIDDDGNADSDSVVIQVVLDAPVASAASIDDPVEAGDTLTLDASGSYDRLGQIKSYQWSWGGTGPPIISALPSVVANAPFSARDTTLSLVLKVVDDDDLESMDTLLVQVRGKAPLEFDLALDSLPMDKQAILGAFVAQGKMWVLAQPGESFPPQGLDLYNSADGIHWSQVWNNGPTRYEYLPTVWEFGGKLWMYVDDGKFARTGYVFRSDDGSDWKLVTDKPPFGSQSNATVSVFNGRMFFFSNRSYTNGELGAVWSSVDGSNWVPETRSYSQGYYHTASFVLGNRLFGLAQSFQPYRFASFSSGDGEEWIPAGGETEGELTAQVGVLHGGRVLLIGGWVSGTGLNFWESRDGSHWKKAGSLPAGVGGRPFAVEFQGNVWLFGQNAPGNSPGYTKIGAWRSR